MRQGSTVFAFVSCLVAFASCSSSTPGTAGGDAGASGSQQTPVNAKPADRVNLDAGATTGACAAEVTQCKNEPICVSLTTCIFYTCMSGDTLDEACAQTCVNNNSAGYDPFHAMLSCCVDNQAAPACN